MKRDLAHLSGHPFDVIIVGGGIYGAAAAWDATLRGLSVALIDENDFCGKTSANSLKIVHGGLRYLQTLDLKRVRESIRERSIFMRIAPHLVHPMPCVMPTYGHMMKGSEVMRIGLLLNDIISFDRNRSGDPEKRIPAGRVVSREECLRLVPGIDPSGVRGGAFWTDAQMINSERMGLAFLLSAADRGASVANYTRITGLLQKDGKVEGIKAKDVFSGESFDIRGRVVIIAAGGWSDQLLDSAGVRHPAVALSTAMNLVIRKRLLPECAAGVYGRFTHEGSRGTYQGRRVLFLAPWRSYTLAGTYHLPYEANPGEMKVTESEIIRFLAQINTAIPGNPVSRADVSFVHKGFLPMDGVDEKTGEVRLTPHYRIIDHGRQGGPKGLVTVYGVKYTTARDVAEKTVTLSASLAGKTGKGTEPGPSRTTALKGGDILRFDDFVQSAVKTSRGRWTEALLRRLITQYGTDFTFVLKLAEDKELAAPVPGRKEMLMAEVCYAVREEMACTLRDVVLRRSDAGSGECPGDETLKACAQVMAKELGWKQARIEKEIEAVKGIYRTVPS